MTGKSKGKATTVRALRDSDGIIAVRIERPGGTGRAHYETWCLSVAEAGAVSHALKLDAAGAVSRDVSFTVCE